MLQELKVLLKLYKIVIIIIYELFLKVNDTLLY